MSAIGAARLSQLDRALDAQPVTVALVDELFSVVDLLERSPMLRRALTDPNSADDARGAVIAQLFHGKVSEAAVAVVKEGVQKDWSSGEELCDALERQAIRAALRTAQKTSSLDALQDELFRLGRLVDGNPELHSALSDRKVSLEKRRSLLQDVFGAKVMPTTLILANRALGARQRTFQLTLDRYLSIAAAMQSRSLVHVTVAKPMTAQQEARLSSVLTRQLGHEVTLQIDVDPTVLGGASVRVGDEVIEGTISGRITKAKQQLN